MPASITDLFTEHLTRETAGECQQLLVMSCVILFTISTLALALVLVLVVIHFFLFAWGRGSTEIERFQKNTSGIQDPPDRLKQYGENNRMIHP